MLVFERPLVLFFLLLLPLWVLQRRLYGQLFRLPLGLIDSRNLAPPAPPLVFRLARSARSLLVVLGFVSAVAAASGPSLLSQNLLYLSRGNEIILVVDVSPSMAAADFAPDRLGAARRLILGLLSSRRNEAVGLVAFGGEAALLSPPTLDYALLAKRLDELKPGLLGEGTALGAGIAVAAAHGLLPGGGSAARERHIVVLTDGENNAGALAPLSAASLAAEGGYLLSVVGIGSRGEVPLNYRDLETGAQRSGTYVSAFEKSSLEALASRGGGHYYDASDGQALVDAFTKIGEASLSLSRTRSVATERSILSPLLLLSLLSLILARLLGFASGSELT